MAKKIKKGLFRMPPLSLAGFMVTALCVGLLNGVVKVDVARAALGSITINSATLTLFNDADGNGFANIGDTIRVQADISNTDGGCFDLGGAGGTSAAVDLTIYGGVNIAIPCITNNGGVNDIFRRDFVIADAAGLGIDVGANNPASTLVVHSTDFDNVAPTVSTNNLGDGVIDTTTTNGVDTSAPTVISATAGDSNSDGKIDRLTVVYSEAVNDPGHNAVAMEGYTVGALDHAAFHYVSATYCQSGDNPTSTITGLAGGNFSSTPPGLAINPATGTLDLATSALGSYSVTYTTAEPHPNTSSIPVTIGNTTPSATFSYSGSPFSQNGTNPLPIFGPGVSAGIFSAPAGLVFANVNTGEINLGVSTPGTYLVTNTIPVSGTCLEVTATTTVVIASSNDVPFIYTAYSISGKDAGATLALTWTGANATDLAGNNLDITGAPANASWLADNTAPTVLSATASDSNSDGKIDRLTVVYSETVNDPNGNAVAMDGYSVGAFDDASFYYGENNNSATYCQSGANPTSTITGLAGGNFSSTPPGLEINPATGTLNLAASALGIYTLSYTTNGLYPNTSSIPMTITNVTPSATFSYTGSPFPQNGTNPLPIFGPGSSAGGFSATPSGLVFANLNTGEINLGVSTPGTYTVTNTIPVSGSCLEVIATTTVVISPSDMEDFFRNVPFTYTYAVSGGGFDTGATPTLTWTGANATDLAGNNLDITGAPTNAADVTGPVIVSARTLSTTTFEIVFSEPISFASIADGDLRYSNAAAGGFTDIDPATELSPASDTTTYTVSVAADNNPFSADEDTGQVKFSGAGVVDDLATPTNSNTQTAAVTIADNITPTVAITSPVIGNSVTASKVITFTDDDTTAPECSVDNTHWTACVSGVTTLGDIPEFAGLTEGAFTIYLRDTDVPGIGADNQPGIIKGTVSSGGGGGGSVSIGSINGAQGNNTTQGISTTSTGTQTTGTNFFSDTATSWSHDFDEKLNAKCGVNGYTDAAGNILHLFKPNNPITRAELVKMVVQCKLGALTAVTSNPFPDVPTSHWAAQYIEKAKELGWVSGYQNGSFMPNQNISRAEALKIILLSQYDPAAITGGTMNFKDTVLGAWYEKYVAFGTLKKIISGYIDTSGQLTGYFGPNNNMLRGEGAKIISNVNGW